MSTPLRQQIEACPNLPRAKFVGRREVILTTPTMSLTLNNAACDAFEQGWKDAQPRTTPTTA